jgi:hypothetical protein
MLLVAQTSLYKLTLQNVYSIPITLYILPLLCPEFRHIASFAEIKDYVLNRVYCLSITHFTSIKHVVRFGLGFGSKLAQISSARKLIGNSSDILTLSQIARRLSTQAVAPHFSVADYFCSKIASR